MKFRARLSLDEGSVEVVNDICSATICWLSLFWRARRSFLMRHCCLYAASCITRWYGVSRLEDDVSLEDNFDLHSRAVLLMEGILKFVVKLTL